MALSNDWIRLAAETAASSVPTTNLNGELLLRLKTGESLEKIDGSESADAAFHH
jgi:hypothetical protein